MTEAQRNGDLDAEYRLLCLINVKASQLGQLKST
jgi:hypothetical protein